MEWYGISCNVKINSKILPATEEKLMEFKREGTNVRTNVLKVLDNLDKEINKCLQKIRG